jgi:hypothetical protein
METRKKLETELETRKKTLAELQSVSYNRLIKCSLLRGNTLTAEYSNLLIDAKN